MPWMFTPAQAGTIHSIPAGFGPDGVLPVAQPIGAGESSKKNARNARRKTYQDQRIAFVPMG
jgi:hypothetical protein